MPLTTFASGSYVLGFGTAVAEPALIAVAAKAAEVMDKFHEHDEMASWYWQFRYGDERLVTTCLIENMMYSGKGNGRA